MVFKSAVDSWFYIVVAITVALVVVSLALARAETAGGMGLAPIGLVFVLSLGLPLWLLMATDYRIEAGMLKIRSGPFRWVVPIANIHSVTASRSALSSPALSLNRLEVTYGEGKRILVSPKDRDGFLGALGHPDTSPETG